MKLCTKEKEERIVRQFQFKDWPDHGILDSMELVQLIDDVREEKSKVPKSGPIIVHCSAGIGRSGTVIAIQILIDQIISGAQSIDVQTVVIGLRLQREGMVQMPEQYRLIYEAVNQWILDKNNQAMEKNGE